MQLIHACSYLEYNQEDINNFNLKLLSQTKRPQIIIVKFSFNKLKIFYSEELSPKCDDCYLQRKVQFQIHRSAQHRDEEITITQYVKTWF